MADPLVLIPADPLQLLCPKCKSKLSWTDADPLVCPGCSTAYGVTDGIPIVRENRDYYHELLPRDRMQELIRRTRQTNWREALAEQIVSAPEQNRTLLRTIFVDENRAAFKAILPPLEGCRVLDLGCGSGVTSVGMARWAREVVSCDLTFERVAFLAQRAREMGLSNIRAICAGDSRPLPFCDASFDCIVLNGVLEWSVADGDRPVREGQVEFLREVRRILKPNGHLYIGIENRFGYGYFLGVPEDHTGVKYAAPVPRWLADWLVRRASGQPYRTYTYGCGGMRRLLGEAGFPSTRFYAPIPDYRDFRELYALDAPNAASDAGTRGIKRRVKEALERSLWFTPSYGVVASPDFVRNGWIEDLASDLRRRFSIRDGNAFPHVRISATSTAGLIVTLGREIVVRVPLDPVNEERIRRNFSGLARAQEIAPVCPGFVAPSPLLADAFHAVPYTVESFVEGIPYMGLTDSQKAQGDRDVFDFLAELKSRGASGAYSRGANEIWNGVVVEPLRALLATLRDADASRGVATLLGFAEHSDKPALPFAFTHGDFWWGNILGGSGRLALIDWDRWSDVDFATHDYLHFVCYRRILGKNITWAEAFSAWLNDAGADLAEIEGTRQFAKRLDLPEGWKPWAGLSYWIREVSGHHPTKSQLDPDWLRGMIGALPALITHLAEVK